MHPVITYSLADYIRLTAITYQSFGLNKKRQPIRLSFFGGEEETRTPAPVTRPTPLAGAPRHQLEYFSIGALETKAIKNKKWRREWDSNPRYAGRTTVFKTVPL